MGRRGHREEPGPLPPPSPALGGAKGPACRVSRIEDPARAARERELNPPPPPSGGGSGRGHDASPLHRYSGPRFAGLRIGLLGGSFNPAHAGHRHISLHALKALGLDRVWWLVSPQNPLKSSRDMASLDERLGWARAVARHPRITVTDLECRLGTRYTADTLAELVRRFPRARFVWLMGADNLRQIPRWREWTRIFESVPIAVFSRPTYSLGALGGVAARRYARRRMAETRARGHKTRGRWAGGLADQAPPVWVFLRNPLHPASATAIRRARARGSEPQ